MKGKDKCKILKEIRAQIAEANGIEWVTENCTHKGECRGTCPKCESEVAALERALARRRALGKTVAVAGISAGMIVSTAMTSSCALKDAQTLDGDMEVGNARTEQTTTAASTTLPLPGEAVTEIGVDGDMAPVYYYSDFVLKEVRLFEVISERYVEGVLTEDDSEYPNGVSLRVGDHFEVVGEAEERRLLLIRYEDAYYCLYSEELAQCAMDVTEGVPDVVDPAP